MDENILESLGSFSNESKESLEKSLIASQKIKNKGYSQDIDMRREYADKTYLFVCIYMCFVFFLIFLACSPSTFQMSDTVLITLLGTTTINVIGLFAIVMNYLFPKK